MTREEFQGVYEQGPDVVYGLYQRMEQTVQSLEQTVRILTVRVQSLEEQLASTKKDSHTSSKPPSSDGLTKKPVSLREKTGKKPGGQVGHKGTTLCLSDTPDETIVHALCNAHLLRELAFVKSLPLQPWAAGMLHLLLEIKEDVDAAREQGRTQLAKGSRDDFRLRYDRWIRDGFSRNPRVDNTGKRGRARQSIATNLLLRLQKHKDAVLCFMDRFDVPFDNNRSEQAVRMMKVKQKISGGFRSLHAAAFFCRIRGYIDTLRKHGQPILPALQHLFALQTHLTQLSG